MKREMGKESGMWRMESGKFDTRWGLLPLCFKRERAKGDYRKATHSLHAQTSHDCGGLRIWKYLGSHLHQKVSGMHGGVE